MRVKNTVADIVDRHRPKLEPLESFYMWLHENPELSHLEKDTSEAVCRELERIGGYDVTARIAGYGVAAVLRNGKGPTILLRADMDALPIEELTGLPYASRRRMRDDEGVERPVMHACGHDMHVTNLVGAAQLMYSARDSWSGTLVLVFQPGEEKNGGAEPMVQDGLYDPHRHNVPVPDVCLGAHVVARPAGSVGTKPGIMLSASDTFRVTLHGRGAHGSQPHLSIDPILMMANVIQRLQGIVSRELALSEHAVVTVGQVQAGGADNVIPAEARMKVNMRTYDYSVRERVMAAIKRIIRAEADASGATKEPDVVHKPGYPVTYNNAEVTQRLSDSFDAAFGERHFQVEGPQQGSEDFSNLGRAINKPCSFWIYGGVDPQLWRDKKQQGKTSEIPGNHSAYFAPVIQPTLKTGLDSYAVAALSWLRKADGRGN